MGTPQVSHVAWPMFPWNSPTAPTSPRRTPPETLARGTAEFPLAACGGGSCLPVRHTLVVEGLKAGGEAEAIPESLIDAALVVSRALVALAARSLLDSGA